MNDEVFFAVDELDSEEPNGELSYLDIVTAAFGSSIFLLFVFATLPLDQAGGAGADQYIDLQIEYVGDIDVELQVARNDELVFRTLDPKFDPDPFTGWSGLPNSDDYQSVHISNANLSEDGMQVIGFRVIGPSAGIWHIYANAAKAREPFDDNTFKSDFAATLLPSCARPCEPKGPAGADIPESLTIRLDASREHEALVTFEISDE